MGSPVLLDGALMGSHRLGAALLLWPPHSIKDVCVYVCAHAHACAGTRAMVASSSLSPAPSLPGWRWRCLAAQAPSPGSLLPAWLPSYSDLLGWRPSHRP